MIAENSPKIFVLKNTCMLLYMLNVHAIIEVQLQ